MHISLQTTTTLFLTFLLAPLSAAKNCNSPPSNFALTGPNSASYVVNTTSRLTQQTPKRTKSGIFSIASVSYGPYSDLQQLTFHTRPTENRQKSLAYGAYAKGSGPVVWYQSQKKALGLGYSIVTAAWSSESCQFVLIPFLNHDTSATYDCGGKVSVYAGGNVDGCKAVKLSWAALR